jgi:hypothetical protein
MKSNIETTIATPEEGS